jgi:hypothetical protein
MLYEAQLFTPLKEIIKVNILQYQGGVSLFNREKEQVVSIDPVALRKAVMDFKVSDGLTPTDKLISGDTLQAALQVIGSSPQIAVAYNIGPLFSYFMKTQGARIQDFEKSSEQLAYEQALGQWQQLTQMVVEAMRGKDPAEVQALIQSLPPQPLPAQFGYNPQQQGAASTTPPQEPKVTNTVQNITRNVTRVG